MPGQKNVEINLSSLQEEKGKHIATGGCRDLPEKGNVEINLSSLLEEKK